MKSIKTGIIVMILSCSALSSFGQNILFGHWKVDCFIERKPDGSVAVCSICPVKLENNTGKINGFELEMSEQNLKIMDGTKTTSLTYTWDSKLETISFEYEKTNYTFYVLKGTSPGSFILKNNSPGGILLLTKM